MKLKTLTKYKNIVENDTLIKWYAQSRHQLGYGTLFTKLRDKLARDNGFVQPQRGMVFRVLDSSNET